MYPMTKVIANPIIPNGGINMNIPKNNIETYATEPAMIMKPRS